MFLGIVNSQLSLVEGELNKYSGNMSEMISIKMFKILFLGGENSLEKHQKIKIVLSEVGK